MMTRDKILEEMTAWMDDYDEASGYERTKIVPRLMTYAQVLEYDLPQGIKERLRSIL